MATVTLTGVFCSGNNHFRLNATGARTASWDFDVDEVRGYDPTPLEIRQAARVFLAIGMGSKTPGQAKAWLQNGVDVAVTA